MAMITKTKIFLMDEDMELTKRLSLFEERINTFLRSHPKIKIVELVQNNFVTTQRQLNLVCTLIYKESITD